MLNAIQNRMVEEALVEKDVYEAMQSMRSKIEGMVGGGTLLKKSSGPNTGNDDLESELPVGERPEGMKVAKKGRVTPSRARSKATGSRAQRHEAESLPKMPVSASGVPADVLAAGDPNRDPSRRVEAYRPVTAESGTADNPFPQLGAKGRPLG